MRQSKIQEHNYGYTHQPSSEGWFLFSGIGKEAGRVRKQFLNPFVL